MPPKWVLWEVYLVMICFLLCCGFSFIFSHLWTSCYHPVCFRVDVPFAAWYENWLRTEAVEDTGLTGSSHAAQELLAFCTTKWCFFTLVSLTDGIQLPALGFWRVFIVEGADGPLGASLASLLAAWPMDSRNSLSLLSQYWDNKCVCCHVWLSYGLWGSNSGPHAGKSSPLPTDPSHCPPSRLGLFSGSHLPPIWLRFPTHLLAPAFCPFIELVLLLST